MLEALVRLNEELIDALKLDGQFRPVSRRFPRRYF